VFFLDFSLVDSKHTGDKNEKDLQKKQLQKKLRTASRIISFALERPG
jgi:hypothetical protein